MCAHANAEQAQRWNGASGQRWVEQRERHAGFRAGLLPHLFAAARIAPGDRVIDVGCGCGDTTIEAARIAGEHGSVTGLDLSGPMLAVARSLAVDAGVAVEFVQGDAQVHPLPPDLDVVISCFGVMFFADPAAAFAHLRDALRPGGRIAFLCWQNAWHNDLFAIPLRAYRAQYVDDDLFAEPDRITALLTGAGFTGVEVRPVVEPARLGSDPTDVIGYYLGMRFVQLLAEQIEDLSPVREELARQLAARQRPDGVWAEVAAWLVTAGRES